MRKNNGGNAGSALRIFSSIALAIKEESTSPEGKMNMWGTIGISIIVVLQVGLSNVEYIATVAANCFRGYKTDTSGIDITIQVAIIACVFVACLIFMGFVISAQNKVPKTKDRKKGSSSK